MGALVGRAVELDALWSAVQDSAGGTGRLVLTEGEPGIGKSRLVHEAIACSTLEGIHAEVVASAARLGLLR